MTIAEFIELDCSSYSNRYEVYGEGLAPLVVGDSYEVLSKEGIPSMKVVSFGLSSVTKNLVRIWGE